ncbi:uncharacterized protein LOC113761003 isoform X1 [Coffea eugenioides]|uniref:uncharacterized protein LOC113761003 isoform X1 n=1 Tax=Coffea eugenioides TaxID=49369 RepID=UPI000F613FB6|nr:uncharacterized protein LOC113761003 isoform X1 [Coffea eugenioides]
MAGFSSSNDEERHCPKLDAERNRFGEKIRHLIEYDKKHELVELLKSQSDIAEECFDRKGLPLSSFILTHCLQFRALNCTEALFEGETGVTLNLDELGVSPLHTAASLLWPKFTKYCLKCGWCADAKVPNRGTDYDGLLPIDYALFAVRRRVYWTQEQSLYLLICELTGEGMIEATQTMRLLIEKMSESNVSEVICRYGAEAKIIELATLLILSTDRKYIRVDDLYMPSSYVSSVDRMTLRQFVVNEIVMLENKLRNLVLVGSYSLAKCKEMKKSMMSILMLLEIFQRTHRLIALAVSLAEQTFPSTAAGIGRVFEDSGFKLSGQETSYLFKPLKLDIPELRMQPSSEEQLPGLHSYFRSGLPELDSFETMPNFGWDESDPEHQKLLPMRAAIEKLCSGANISQWTPKESTFKLVIMLFLLKMKETWETASSLAQNLEKINEISCCYAKEGKLIELSIILLVAREKVMCPIVFQIRGEKCMRSMTLLQFINSEMAQAIDLECRLTGRKTKLEEELDKLCKQRKLNMMSALELLEIFEKAGSALQKYFWSERGNVQREKVIKDVCMLLSEAGFDLKEEEIELHDAVDSSIEVEQQNEALQDPHKSSDVLRDLSKIDEMATERGCQRQHLTRQSYVLPCGFVESYATCGRPNDMRNFLFARYPRECFNLPSGAQSFRAFWTSKDSKARYCTSIPKAFGVQVEPVRGVNWLVQKLPASKRFASVALAAKKLIRGAS